jgi:hypothetical protein
VFSITSSTQDLDQKFCEALDSLAFDLGGKLVKSFTIAGKDFPGHLSLTLASCPTHSSRRIQAFGTAMEYFLI